MKLSSFEVSTKTGPKQRLGVLSGEDMIDVTEGYAQSRTTAGDPAPVETSRAFVPPDMTHFLQRGKLALEAADRARSVEPDQVRGPSGARIRYSLDEIDVLSPLPKPNSIRAFSVFEEHLLNTFPSELPDIWYEQPLYWKGNPNSIIHPNEEMPYPSFTDELDFEIELGAVIGKEGRDISAEHAEEHVVGYTIHNDWSARDIQMREMEMGLGPAKGKDFANSFGPYLATPDEIDLENFTYTVRVNGEVWLEREVEQMQHSFSKMIEHASMGQTLYPGDVLVSGTLSGGCSLELDRWIQVGDTLELAIEGIGSLTNTIIEKE